MDVISVAVTTANEGRDILPRELIEFHLAELESQRVHIYVGSITRRIEAGEYDIYGLVVKHLIVSAFSHRHQSSIFTDEARVRVRRRRRIERCR